MIQAAEIRNDGQLGDILNSLQVTDLADNLLRGADEGDSLPDDFVVGEFGERFERAAGVKGVTLRAQLGFLRFAPERFDGGRAR